jgi:hypothetical protein
MAAVALLTIALARRVVLFLPDPNAQLFESALPPLQIVRCMLAAPTPIDRPLLVAPASVVPGQGSESTRAYRHRPPQQ